MLEISTRRSVLMTNDCESDYLKFFLIVLMEQKKIVCVCNTTRNILQTSVSSHNLFGRLDLMCALL